MLGMWKPTHLKQLCYGSGSVAKHLVSSLPSSSSKAFIITGSSLATKTALVQKVEQYLGNEHHAGTFSNIKQHALIQQLDEATDIILRNSSIDTVISIGGGSPIDSAKAISYRLHEKNVHFLFHIAIPTTLSAAECSMLAGYTNAGGSKVGLGHPEIVPQVVLYDSTFALETPPRLWLSTGLRALDHAVELLCNPSANEMPTKQLCLQAAADLFIYLRKYKQDPKNEEYITKLQLASFASLGFWGTNVKGGLGLSHSLGYALGSPYSIPHGITSCLTLGRVVKLKAENADDASQIARVLPFIGRSKSDSERNDAIQVGEDITDLVRDLGLETTLREHGVPEDDAPAIVRAATRMESGELYERVLALVRDLY